MQILPYCRCVWSTQLDSREDELTSVPSQLTNASWMDT